jgi:excinuclease UvrABC nuclease subunit
MKNNNNTILTPVQEINNLHLTDLLVAALKALKGLSGIYCIKCLDTGTMYIGSATDLSKRLAEHLIYGEKSNEHLQRALAFYGLIKFSIQIF